MTFLNPLLLFGMAAIAAPIIIHMFMNRRIKPVIWAAMRFLQASVQKNQRRMNIEDLLLLALRCLMLILLALALARPIIGHVGDAGAGKGGETAVIALDNSYSMGHSDSSASRFDQARAAAEQVIDSLPAGSSVAVLLFSDVVRAAIPEPTYDLNLARKVVRDAPLSARTTDVQAVLRQAMETLGRHTTGGQGVYLITDGQAVGWKKFNDITGTLRNPAVKSRLILVGDPETHNLCVSGIRQASSIATVGESIQFDVEIHNFGTGEEKDVSVRIAVDDESPCDEGVISSIPAGGSKHLSLFTKFRTAGYHTVTGQINADHLPSDDRRTLAVRATDDVRVLLVDGEPKPEASDSATFYLRNALTPAPLPERENYVVKTKTISPSEIASTKLSDFEAVILANVPQVSATALEGVAAYLNQGGGLVVFPGP
ncbi:MAG: BatA domain-containing protein, partial [Chthoniobacteraceae bacterium]|nr:BatA domain-containing protein [Chthoniobacteraceae bacterium]